MCQLLKSVPLEAHLFKYRKVSNIYNNLTDCISLPRQTDRRTVKEPSHYLPFFQSIIIPKLEMNREDYNPLIAAINGGDVAAVESFLQTPGIDVDFIFEAEYVYELYTPLNWAILYNRQTIVATQLRFFLLTVLR